MIFLENNTADGAREGLNYTEEQEHAEQVSRAAHYQMAIVGWGEDEVADGYHGEEGKLHTILARIKAASPNTTTVAYCGYVCVVVYRAPAISPALCAPWLLPPFCI